MLREPTTNEAGADFSVTGREAPHRGGGSTRPYRSVAALIGISTLALAAAIFTWRQRSQLPAPASGQAVRTATVASGIVDSTVRLTGVTVSRDSVTLRAPEAAPPRSVPPGGSPSAAAERFGHEEKVVVEDVVAPGTMVTAGQVVARFEHRFTAARLDDYRAAVGEREAEVRTEKADLDEAARARQEQIASAAAALEKARSDMRAIPVLSAMDAERTRLDFDEAEARYQQLQAEQPLLKASAEADLRAAELDLESARLELKRVEESAGTTVVVAPSAGLVVLGIVIRDGLSRPIQPGDEIPSGEPFMKIAGSKAILIEAVVNEADLARMRPGAKATIRFDAYPALTLPGTLETVGEIGVGGGVLEAPAWLRLDRSDRRVIPDLSVSADVELSAPLHSPAVVPAGAVFHSTQGQPFVFLRGPDGWTRREVGIAGSNELYAAASSGLSPGDVVALDPPQGEGR